MLVYVICCPCEFIISFAKLCEAMCSYSNFGDFVLIDMNVCEVMHSYANSLELVLVYVNRC